MELYPGRWLRDPDQPIDLPDLAGVILANWTFRQEGQASDVVAWHQYLLTLLLTEFGVGWEDDIGPREAQLRGLPLIARRLPRLYASIPDPTDGVFEYTPRSGEQAVLDHHLPCITQAADALRSAWRAFLCDLLLLRWPGARSRTTTLRRLRDAGLPDRPEKDDVF
ncbi:hypothetical protein [Neoroseomonas oryzicola]|uniref:Uncharacterized protein n=1 Tax=Neoroseomonas oryzicola TaxID=535904 RepID=A0A9X9WJH8_9PROT|nr:hypothetical protein [Neoroseomonas oryzicola]MBR0660488.1 hypothetical protein [Neoroseomonas oryzicola]NKE18256.1 hypothetical protein [Neoroseomonas oryzicola]